MKIGEILISLLILTSSSFAQLNSYWCGTDEYMEQLFRLDPELKLRMTSMEETLQETISRNPSFLSTETITVIPVVVHVVYHTEEQNIADSVIYSQIDVLNEDFRRMPGTNGWNDNPVGTDTKYEFRLATVDPSGEPTTGITRTYTDVLTFSIDNTVKFNASGGHDAWQTDKYLNIWVCNLGGGYKGYSQFPGGDPSTDGVVILYTAFGRPTANPPYNYGRTTTHEIGHWLYLYHTFQNGCDPPGDFCADTPYQFEPNLGCPAGHVSCGTEDMIENYMDYTDDICKNIYTLDQDNRMDATMNVFRNGLLVTYKETIKIESAGVNYVFTDVNNTPFTVLNFSDTGTTDSVTVEVWQGYYPPGLPRNRKAVKRFFEITPHGGEGFTSVLRVYYDDSEVTGFINGEANLQLYLKSGSNWIRMGGIVDTVENSITLSNVTQFGTWAISDPDDQPIPVELISFTSSVDNNNITLRWVTATETNNLGFEIERKKFNSLSGESNEAGEWNKIGFVPGHGNSTEQNTYSFIDEQLEPGLYNYRLKIVDHDGSFEYSNILSTQIKSPDKFTLNQNYPNPFNPSTKIVYQIPERAYVTLKVYDVLGNEVTELVNKTIEAGKHEIIFDASNLTSGVYFYTIFTDGFTQTRKMILMR